MRTKIPATIITGFLGAGKTTLIRHLLAHAGGRRIALIVNEFGDVGVDGALLSDCGDPGCEAEAVVELANGCICCTVADDFLPAMEMLLAREPAPDHIVIETSGLALPQPLVRAFAWPEVRARVTVDGVVTVADGPAIAAGLFAHDHHAVEAARAADDSVDHETPLGELFEDQITCADLVVLSKADLMDAAALAEAEHVVGHDARPGVRILRAAKGAVPVAALLGLGVAAEDDDRKSHHDHEGHEHDHDDFDSFVLDLPEAADAGALKARVAAAMATPGVLRIKGFAGVAGKPMRLVVQAVGPRVETYFDRPFRGDEARGTRLVVIGETGMDRAAIGAALAERADAA